MTLYDAPPGATGQGPHEPPAVSPTTRTATFIGRLVPLASAVEVFGDTPESALLPAEADVVTRSTPERRREFATVRWCARMASLRLGVAPFALLPGTDGAPRWPRGIVGSLTHCAGYRAAAVARSTVLRAVGIDAEPHAALPHGTTDYVLRADERARLRDLAMLRPGLHWDRIAFCAKEAAYKAWYPLTRVWLDFADVAVVLRDDGSFRVRPGRAPKRAGAPLEAISGRWDVGRGLIIAAATIGHGPAGLADVVESDADVLGAHSRWAAR